MLDSKDVLFFVLAFCVLWFTLFLSWLIFQVARLLKNVNDVLAEAKDRLQDIERALLGMKERLEKATSIAVLVGNGLERLVEHFLDRGVVGKEKKKKE
jgi:hypothetical protein